MTGKLTRIRNSSWMNTIGRISFRELFSIFFPVSRKAQHKMTTNLLEWKVECKLYDRCKHVNLANVMSCATLYWLKCLQSITILVWALLPIKPQLWLDLMSMPVQSALKHRYSVRRVVFIGLKTYSWQPHQLIGFLFPQQFQPPLPTSTETAIASCHDIQQIHT